MKPIRYITDKQDGQPFKILNAEMLKNELDGLPKGRYELTVKKLHRKSSPKQFGWLYGVVYPLFMMAANNMGYEFTSIEQLDFWCKQQWANTPIMNRETGEIIPIPQTKSEFLTTDEMVYCNTLRDYAAEYFGVIIPDPDKDYKNKTK